MKLITIIKRLEKKRQDYVKKHGHEPVVFDIESDTFRGDLILTLVKGKKKSDYGTMATSVSEYAYVKWNH